MGYSRHCDVCKARGIGIVLAVSHRKWKHGIRVDTCKSHELDIFQRKDWLSWQVDFWLQAGAPENILVFPFKNQPTPTPRVEGQQVRQVQSGPVKKPLALPNSTDATKPKDFVSTIAGWVLDRFK